MTQDDQQREQECWDQVKDLVQPTIDFWVDWLRDDEPSPEKKVCPDLLLCIIRAISWVESRHGCGTGNFPERDPMQIGNPNDSGWENIGNNPSTDPGERPIREGVLPGLSWEDIPGDVDRIINGPPPPEDPVLPYNIDPTFLPDDGHKDEDFTKEMSYFWGIIWYLYSLQVGSELGAWKIGNCEPANLMKGVEWWGPRETPRQIQEYRQKIEEALCLIGCGDAFNLECD